MLTDLGFCWSFNAEKVRDLYKKSEYIDMITDNFLDDEQLDKAAGEINRWGWPQAEPGLQPEQTSVSLVHQRVLRHWLDFYIFQM